MYISYEEYTALYGDIAEKTFDRLSFEACRHLDRLTTGVDGVKKLKVAFPSDEDDAAAVACCAASVVNILAQIHEAEQSASLGRGYDNTPNGLQGKIISAVSAGGESITYSTGGAKTAVDAAISDIAARNRLIASTVRNALSGICDANGVCLLYMGAYPR